MRVQWPTASVPRMRCSLMLGMFALALRGALAATPDPGESRDRLRQIVQGQCVPNWRSARLPAPCASVTLGQDGSLAGGFAVLHDRKGGAHLLLIPTRTLAGIESPGLAAGGAVNYFAAAWRARPQLEQLAGRRLARTDLALAVNQREARSQDQLHIHISCLDGAVRREVVGQLARLRPGAWSWLPVGSFRYRARLLRGAQLDGVNPVALLERLPEARGRLERYTLLVFGIERDGVPGFVLLAGESVPGAELLLDPACARP